MRALPNRTRRVRAAMLGAAGAALILAACTSGGDDDASTSTTTSTSSTTTIPREDDGTLVLGVYLPVTGGGSELGQPMISAVEQAVERINAAGGVLGQPVRIIPADEGASTGPEELLAAGVDAIVGPASSLTVLSQMAPAVDADTGVVVCSPSATSLLIDDYPDHTFLFRTAPSDSMQMAAIARQVQRTGARSVAVGYLDDPYGRGLRDAFLEEAADRPLTVPEPVGFSADQTDLSDSAALLIDADPGVIVVLGDSDDGGRLLAALDAAEAPSPPVIVNDAIRQARQTIQSLSDEFREYPHLTGVAPLSQSDGEGAPEGFFTAHAVDCVNMIALSVLAADTDAPIVFRRSMAGVSAEGRSCSTFEGCADLLAQGLNIDYDGASGSAELGNTTGDPIEARFQSFGFDSDGTEIEQFEFDMP